jgi:GDPmannose 4,6-dehydratase
MYLILQQDKPDDYVLATGEMHTVREFIEVAFAEVGRKINWRGQGVAEEGVDAKTGEVLVKIDPRYFRPTEVELLLGDPSKARKVLGWKHEITFPQLVKEMVASDLKKVADEGKRNS